MQVIIVSQTGDVDDLYAQLEDAGLTPVVRLARTDGDPVEAQERLPSLDPDDALRRYNKLLTYNDLFNELLAANTHWIIIQDNVQFSTAALLDYLRIQPYPPGVTDMSIPYIETTPKKTKQQQLILEPLLAKPARWIPYGVMVDAFGAASWQRRIERSMGDLSTAFRRVRSDGPEVFGRTD